MDNKIDAILENRMQHVLHGGPPLMAHPDRLKIDVSGIEEMHLARYLFSVWFSISLANRSGLCERFSEIPDIQELHRDLCKRNVRWLGDIPAKIIIEVDEEAGKRVMDVTQLLRWGGPTYEEMVEVVASLPRLH